MSYLTPVSLSFLIREMELTLAVPTAVESIR